MKLYKDTFLKEMFAELGITKKQFREMFPNDENLWVYIAEKLIQERKIKADENMGLADFLSDYKPCSNARLLIILVATEISPEIKELQDSASKQRRNALSKIIRTARKKGEISDAFVRQFKYEFIVSLFFEIVDVRVAASKEKSNDILMEETKVQPGSSGVLPRRILVMYYWILGILSMKEG
jgi:hypothetical protein